MLAHRRPTAMEKPSPILQIFHGFFITLLYFHKKLHCWVAMIPATSYCSGVTSGAIHIYGIWKALSKATYTDHVCLYDWAAEG